MRRGSIAQVCVCIIYVRMWAMPRLYSCVTYIRGVLGTLATEYGGEPWNDEKKVLNQMNQGSVEEQTFEVEVFVVDLGVILMIVRTLIVNLM